MSSVPSRASSAKRLGFLAAPVLVCTAMALTAAPSASGPPISTSWSWVVTAWAMVALYGNSRHRVWGIDASLASQPMAVVYALLTGQLSFLAGNAAATFILVGAVWATRTGPAPEAPASSAGAGGGPAAWKPGPMSALLERPGLRPVHLRLISRAAILTSIVCLAGGMIITADPHGRPSSVPLPWVWMLVGSSLLILFANSRKLGWGNWLGALVQPLWIIHALLTGQFGFIVGNVIRIAIFLTGVWKHRKQREAAAPPPERSSDWRDRP